MTGLDPNDFLIFVSVFMAVTAAPWLVQKAKGTLSR